MFKFFMVIFRNVQKTNSSFGGVGGGGGGGRAGDETETYGGARTSYTRGGVEPVFKEAEEKKEISGEVGGGGRVGSGRGGATTMTGSPQEIKTSPADLTSFEERRAEQQAETSTYGRIKSAIYPQTKIFYGSMDGGVIGYRDVNFLGLRKYTMKLKPSEDISFLQSIQGEGLEYKFANFGRGVIRGGYESLRQQPEKTLIVTGGTALLTGGGSILGRSIIGGATFLRGASAGIKVQKALKITGTGLGILGISLYSASKGFEIYQTPGAMGKGFVVGKATTTEIIPTIAGSYAGFKGAGKITGYVRTFGKTYIPPEKIIAPEIFKGQTFPTIKRGQTAGQLKKEFYQPVQEIGEIGNKPRMFTATPTTFAKKTTVLKGSSELPGLYGAPRANPYFATTNQKYKIFGVGNIFESNNPTLLRTNLNKLKYVGGVSSKTKSTISKTQAKTFLKTKAKEGTAYIPFIKTEKEAILTEGTKIIRTNSKFYTIYEGERAPIYQYNIIKGKGKIPTETIGKVNYLYSSSSKKTTLFNPSFISSSFKKGASYKTTNYYSKPSISSISSITSTPSYYSKPSTTSKGSGFYYRPVTKVSGYNLGYRGYSSGFASSFTTGGYSSRRTPNPYFLGIGLPSSQAGRFSGGRKKTQYVPSYSALLFKIGGTYKGSRLSKSGIDFRPITKGYSFERGRNYIKL